MVIFTGWFAPRGTFRSQLTNGGTMAVRLYPVVSFIVRWVAPLLILVILATSI